VHDVESGAIVRVLTHAGDCVAVGVYAQSDMIAVRVLSWRDEIIDDTWVAGALSQALTYRTQLGFWHAPESRTTGYRVHFAEADSIPGLIVDVYNDVLVIQIHTRAAELFRESIIKTLIALFQPRAIVERSESSHRASEGLESREGIVYGECTEPVVFREYGVEYLSFPLTGQKTGFFCDQKDVRKEIRALARGRTVLNVCSYTGAQSVAAMHGGAESAHNIDISDAALAGCEAHRVHHGYTSAQFTSEQADVFQWAAQQKNIPQSFVIFDPPALIKSQREKEGGMKGYHFLNRALLRAIQPGTLFATSSCSQFFSEEDMLHMLQKASLQAERRLRIIKIVRQSADHPQSLYFPQSSYLKSVIGVIE
jgi:23S rRNA (cytosine1962-C5)-methyltransferase